MLKFQQNGVYMKKYFNVIRKCPLFEGIEDNELMGLMGCLGAKVMSFEKKYTIFTEGSRARFLGIVLSGSAQIIQIDYYGNRSIIHEIEEAELFGEAFACAEMESIPVSVIANEACEILLIECQRILHTCENACGFHQRLIFNLMKDIATKAIMFQQKIEIVSKRSTREKLLAYLNMQARKTGSRSFSIPFDRQELADYLEVERSGLSSEIGKLKKNGIINCSKNSFELL